MPRMAAMAALVLLSPIHQATSNSRGVSLRAAEFFSHAREGSSRRLRTIRPERRDEGTRRSESSPWERWRSKGGLFDFARAEGARRRRAQLRIFAGNRLRGHGPIHSRAEPVWARIWPSQLTMRVARECWSMARAVSVRVWRAWSAA